MARLRYLQNKRSGAAGTISKSTNKIYFFDDNAYIYGSSSGVLNLTATTLDFDATTLDIDATTIQLTGALELTGDLTYTGTLSVVGAMTFSDTLNATQTGIAITDAAGNGRRCYWQFTATSIEGGEQLTGLQLRASWAGTSTESTSGITGIEIKARANNDSITDTLGTAKAIIANVDCKKATFTTAWGVESQFDLSAGGTITTGAAFRASLNNSGTFSTSYAYLVETANVSYNWDYGLYMTDGQTDTGIYIGNATTGISLDGTFTTGLGVAGTLGTASARAIKSNVTINNCNLTDGVGTNEFQLSITGSGAGHIATTSSWLNIPSGTQGAGGSWLTPLTVGVWEASGATINGASITFGMHMQVHLGDADAARLCPFSINVSGDSIDAIWNAASPADYLGYAASTNDGESGIVPYLIDSNGRVWYIRLYDS